jgi:hypothetical protein
VSEELRCECSSGGLSSDTSEPRPSSQAVKWKVSGRRFTTIRAFAGMIERGW